MTKVSFRADSSQVACGYTYLGYWDENTTFPKEYNFGVGVQVSIICNDPSTPIEFRMHHKDATVSEIKCQYGSTINAIMQPFRKVEKLSASTSFLIYVFGVKE